jgi:hypothetical protein
MDTGMRCEFCERLIKGEPVTKVLRGQEHIYCTEFCFRLAFYDVPRITLDDLNKMYALRCVTVRPPDFRSLIVEES